MSKDTPRIGGPSSWSSDEPAAGPPLVHSHPLPPSVRVILVVYGIALATVLGGLFWIVIDGQHRDEKAREAVVKTVEDDLDKAAKAQAKKEAAANKQTQVLVCRFLLEFKQTPNVKALARQFRCDLALAASPSPAPAPTTYVYSPDRPPVASTRPAPAPHSSSSPTAKPTQKPSPKPSPTCLLPQPVPCVGPKR